MPAPSAIANAEPMAIAAVSSTMKRSNILGLVAVAIVALGTCHFAVGREKSSLSLGVKLPQFTQTAADAWINSPPLTTEALRGKVLLIDFWAFECWNCYRSFPWLNQLESHFKDRDFRVIGIHSPEFDRERDANSVRKKVAEFELKHPVMLDNDFAFWRAMGNRYWPAYYLVDKQGQVRHVFVGETHEGDAQSRRIRTAIGKLLGE